MDPLVVFDCQQVLPNRFVLALAAAARTRALARGSAPRLDKSGTGLSELALHEIAGGLFTQDELTPFLPGSGDERFLPPSDPDADFAVTAGATVAAHISRSREMIAHDATQVGKEK